MPQKFDSKMHKHLEDGGLVELVKDKTRITYGLHEVLCSSWRDDAVWEYKAGPKYVWTRVVIYPDGAERDDYWYPSKEAFMKRWSEDIKFGKWQRRLATEVSDD